MKTQLLSMSSMYDNLVLRPFLNEHCKIMSLFFGRVERNPEASLCNHQCVVQMLQKMLPVHCNRKYSIKRLIRYQGKK